MRDKGFTLVELLVVVAILSATALAAFGLVSEDRTQIRGDDTRNRLTLLRRAVVGLDTPAYGGELRLSGYVADNGRLPESILELLTNPNGLRQRGGVQPEFHSSINDECLSTGTGNNLGPAARLLKGHRGNYLSGASRTQVFRDGWGNEGADDSINFGWVVTQSETESETETETETEHTKLITFTSLGADNQSGATNGLESEEDLSITVEDSDWRVPLDGWQVTVRNTGNTSISHVGIALLVFENTSSGGQWRQYRTQSGTCGTSLAAGESCILTFTNKTECTSTKKIDAKVPLGRHVIVLTKSSSLLKDRSDRPIIAQADFFPGVHLPPLTLDVLTE